MSARLLTVSTCSETGVFQLAAMASSASISAVFARLMSVMGGASVSVPLRLLLELVLELEEETLPESSPT